MGAIHYFPGSHFLLVRNVTESLKLSENAYSEKGGESASTQYATDKTPTVSFERPRNTHFRTQSINSWMLQQDYDYRVIGDGDMDDYSELQNSRLLIVAGHNEYWTAEAKVSYDRFVQEGGLVMILGGNTMYRKVEYPSDTTDHEGTRTVG